MRSFSSVQTFHTHTLLSRAWKDHEVKMRMTRNEGEMSMKMRWELLKPGRRTGNAQEKRRNQERTPTPTHLARSGRTLERQGKRKSGGRRKKTKTSGGGGKDGRAWTNLPQRKQSLPKHARTQTYLERGSTHEIGDQWGPSWWQTETKPIKGFSSMLKNKVVRYSLKGTAVGQPKLGK